MASSTDEAKNQMMAAIGITDVEELFEQIPKEHRSDHEFSLPEPLEAEVALRRHLVRVLGKNRNAESDLSFLGGGTWQHHVPAVCDEIWSRSEFLTSVWGTPSSDVGRNQAWFEYASQLGELVGMEFVGLPVYSWGAALGHAMRMAARITERKVVLIPESIGPDRLAVAATYCGFPEQHDHIEIVEVPLDRTTGKLDLEKLGESLDASVAAVYFENPSFLGVFEERGAEIAALAKAAGAEVIVGVDPMTLGIVKPPIDYGADIAIGSTQPLGVHMNGGGGVGGFIATRDEERYVRQYPTLQVSLAPTVVPGERGFGMTLFGQSSYGAREQGNDWTGNSVYLWAIANAAYMAMMGPAGFEELGDTIMSLSQHAAHRIDQLPSMNVTWPQGFFKEFVVDFNETGRTVAEINSALRDKQIFGGGDLSVDVPWLGQAALYCVTEVHSVEDIERLVEALEEVTS